MSSEQQRDPIEVPDESHISKECNDKNGERSDVDAPMAEGRTDRKSPASLVQGTILSVAFATIFAVVVIVAYSHVAKSPNPIKQVLHKQEELLIKSNSIESMLLNMRTDNEEAFNHVRDTANILKETPRSIIRHDNAPRIIEAELCNEAINQLDSALNAQGAGLAFDMAQFIADVLNYADQLESSDITPTYASKFISVKTGNAANRSQATALRKLISCGLDTSSMDSIIEIITDTSVQAKALTMRTRIIDYSGMQANALAKVRVICGTVDTHDK